MSNMNKNSTHTIFQVGQKYPSCENGIWIDFKDDTFLFVVKDDIWTTEEVSRLKTSDVTVSFIQKGIIDAFILEIFDCLEASDLPFYVKDGDTDFIEAIKSKNLFGFEIVFVSGNDEVVAVRHEVFSKEESTALHERLQKRLLEETEGSMFEAAYEKLTSRFEPFELLEFAVFTKNYSLRKN